MGASLYPMLREVSPGRRYALLLLLTDANWAVSAQDYQNGRRNLEVIIGGGLVLWLAWIVGTALGVYFGGLLQNPKAFGLDMVLGCFLLAMALGGNKSPRVLVAWCVSGAAPLPPGNGYRPICTWCWCDRWWSGRFVLAGTQTAVADNQREVSDDH